MGIPPMHLKTFQLIYVYFFLDLATIKNNFYIHLIQRPKKYNAKDIMALMEVYVAIGTKVSSK
jgi:hypothetical protein